MREGILVAKASEPPRDGLIHVGGDREMDS
jgi:hypothetical protein